MDIENFIYLTLLATLYYLAYKKIPLLLVRFYIIIQIIIYIFPQLLSEISFLNIKTTHNLYHPDILPYYTKSFIYIFCFDFILFTTVYILTKIRPLVFHKTFLFKIFIKI